MTDLGTLGGTSSSAYRISDRGQVVGTSMTASGERHAFLWEDGVVTDLGADGESSSAWDINNWGQVVGVAASSQQEGSVLSFGRTGCGSTLEL